MTPRGVLWRLLLWLGVAAFFVTAIFTAIVTGDLTAILGFPMFPIVGAIILSSRPGNAVGWVLYAIGLAWVLTGPLSAGIVTTTLPPWVEAVVVPLLSWFGWGLIPLIGAVFPTGRIETRLGRLSSLALVVFLGIATLATMVSPTNSTSGRPNPLSVPALYGAVEVILGPVGILFFLLGVVGIVVDLALRWRRSTGARRLQYRWLVFGLTVAIATVAASGLLHLLFPDDAWVNLVTPVLLVVVNLIPISIGIAVTRHGLYEIGSVVSRTVAFAIVTVVVVGVYAGVVTSVSLLLPEQSTIAVAAATLIAAAVFLPVLRRVQRAVERRFDRERYDAQEVVEQFGGRLRTAVDPDATAPDLVAAVERTLQPRSVGVWTTGGSR